MNKYRTMLKDLPELDDGHISEHNQLGNKEYSQVKQQHHPYNGYEMHQQHQQQFRPMYDQQPHGHPHQHPHQVHQHIPSQQQYQEPIEEPEPPSYTPSQMMTPEEISCKMICAHIESCPICTKFYSRDNSQLIIIIVALIVFNIYLLRKLLN